jgi:PAS domain S-box-containing protein
VSLLDSDDLERTAPAPAAPAIRALERSDDAVIVQDLRGRIIGWSRGAERLYGYLRDEALRLEAEALTADGGRDQAQGLLDAIRGGDEVASLEVARRTRDGRTLRVWATATPLLDQEGRRVAVATTERDITDREQLLEALRESADAARRSSALGASGHEGALGVAERQRSDEALHPGEVITERKQGLEALRKSEERFRALVTASSDVVYRMSPDWSEMRELRGREFIADTASPSRSWLERYIHPDDQPLVLATIQEAIRNRSTFQLEHRVLRVDGSLGWTFSRAIPLMDQAGEIVEWFGAASDVTARKHAEEALRASEERFRLLVQGVKEYAIYMLAPDGTVKSWSAAAEHLFGYREDEIVGRHRTVLFTPEQRAEGLPGRDLEGALTDRHHDEGWRVRKDGSRFFADVLVTALRDDAGRLRGFVNVTRDVTERRRAEAALRASEERLRVAQQVARAGSFEWDLRTGVNNWTPELEALYGLLPGGFGGTEADWERLVHPDDRAEAIRRVERGFESGEVTEGEWRAVWPDGSVHWLAGRWRVIKDPSGKPVRMTGINFDITDRKRAEELHASEAALREADRQKNQFLAILSHELRNPLAPIRNSLYLLERGAPGGALATRALAVIDRQIGQMTRLIDDLLDVTRITRGKIRLQRERLDLQGLVQRTVEDHRSTFARGEIRLTMLDSSGEVPIDGDRVRLAQAIGNLLQNAAKFTPRGGDTTVSLQTDRSRGEAVLTVRDTGSGIQPEMLPRLFHPFSQADATLDRSKGGLGLGLALVKGLVELHGGSVTAASGGPGRGAAFTIRLPLATTHAGAVRSERGARAGSRLPRRVLVIEDNEDAADTLREVLELDDHVVEVAYSGRGGIEKARTFRPDIVFCDIGLPEVDGYEVARTLRADPELASVVLVAVSGYAQPEDVAMSREAGFDAHLAKPATLETLGRVLADLDGRGDPLGADGAPSPP